MEAWSPKTETSESLNGGLGALKKTHMDRNAKTGGFPKCSGYQKHYQ